MKNFNENLSPSRVSRRRGYQSPIVDRPLSIVNWVLSRYRVLGGALMLQALLVGCGGDGDAIRPSLEPPVMADAQAQTYTAGVTIPTLIFANSGGGSLAECTVDPALPNGLIVQRSPDIATCQITGTPTTASARVAYTVTAVKISGSDDALVNITVNPSAPSLTDVEARVYFTGTTIVDLFFTNNGGGLLNECSVEPALPTGLSIERSSDNATCQLTGTPRSTTERATYIVTATNITGSDDASVGITIMLTAPSLADAAAQTYIRGTAITALVFANSGGDALTDCSVEPGIPAGLSIERSSDNATCRLTGTPTVLSVQTSYTVTATNAVGNGEATVEITINPPLPSLANVDLQIYAMDEAITDLAFSNNGGGALSDCSVEPNLPAGLSIGRPLDNSTCRLTGTPTAVTAQDTYTVTATNATGSDNISVDITVNLFSLSLREDQALIFGVGNNVSIPFINNRGGTLTACSSDPDLPAGLTVGLSSGNASCRLTGIPLLLSAQSNYTITATNSMGSGAVRIPLAIGNTFLPTGVRISGTTTELSWTALATAGSYEVWRAEVGDGGEISRLQTGVTTTSYTDDTLTAGDYYYLIAECTELGCVDPSHSGPVAVGSLANDITTGLIGANGVTITTIEDEIYALVASPFISRVQIINITDPSSPTPVFVLEDTTEIKLMNASDITTATINDKIYALVAVQGENSLLILDISTPSSPLIQGSLSDSDEDRFELDGAHGITTTTIDGKLYALVAARTDDGMQIIDVSNPVMPRGAGSVDDSSGPGELELNGAQNITAVNISGSTYALIAAQEDEGIQIIDVSKPDEPMAVGSLDDSSDPDRLELLGPFDVTTTVINNITYALVTAFDDDGIQIIDISDPSSPRPVGSLDDDAQVGLKLDGARGIEIVAIGNKVYALVAAAEDNGIQVLDVSDPTEPIAVGSLADTEQTLLQGSNGIATFTNGGRIYAVVTAQIDLGIQIIDVTTPQRVTPAATSQ